MLKVIEATGNARYEHRNFILSHQALSAHPDGEDRHLANIPSFRDDLERGRFVDGRGSYAAYHKGVFCGQGSNPNELYERAVAYYGGSNLAVFRVPHNFESLEEALKDALGDYR